MPALSARCAVRTMRCPHDALSARRPCGHRCSCGGGIHSCRPPFSHRPADAGGPAFMPPAIRARPVDACCTPFMHPRLFLMTMRMYGRWAWLAGSCAVMACLAPTTTAAQAAPPRSGTIVGVVIDSLHETPLAQAEVTLDGTSRSVRTNADGRFRLDSVAPGPARLGVFHALL